MAFTPKILVISNLQTTSPLWAFHSRRPQVNILLETDPGNAVRSWAEKIPDLVLFDLAADNPTVLDLIRKLRDEAVVPILLLTVDRTEEFALEAYHAGVDDCILKPISPSLFDAKLRAWLRRSAIIPLTLLDPLKIEDFNLIPSNRTLVVDDNEPIHLTNLEVRFLYTLMGRHGRTVTFEELCERVWGTGGEGNVMTLKNVVYRLCRKIEANPSHPHHIHTVAGVGYQFAAK